MRVVMDRVTDHVGDGAGNEGGWQSEDTSIGECLLSRYGRQGIGTHVRGSSAVEQRARLHEARSLRQCCEEEAASVSLSSRPLARASGPAHALVFLPALGCSSSMGSVALGGMAHLHQ